MRDKDMIEEYEAYEEARDYDTHDPYADYNADYNDVTDDDDGCFKTIGIIIAIIAILIYLLSFATELAS